MAQLENFDKQFPNQTKELADGKTFTYRYYKNPSAKATLVLLTGGIGLSDLLYVNFEKFTKEFSVITFDYQIQFSNINELMSAIAEVLTLLNEKVWLVGQSLGGIISEIFAKQYPDLVEGLILSNTCCLAKDMSKESYAHLNKMLKSQSLFKILVKILPFSLYKKLITKALMSKVKEGNEDEKTIMENFCKLTELKCDKPYEIHMIELLIDCGNHMDMVQEDFKKWDDKVLIILSEDDNTFNDACKNDLKSIMTNPTVITDITGGHLALIIKCDEYIEKVSNYINKRI